MSFRTSGLSEGVLLPEELRLVQDVYKRISREGLLSNSPDEQHKFAAYVMKAYFRGVIEPERLYRFCRAAAKAKTWRSSGRKVGPGPDQAFGIRLPACKILVVEDDFTQATDIKTIFEKAGAAVLGPVSNEQDAIVLVDTEVPDLALVDLNLGNGVTFSVAQHLHEQSIPICVVTGYVRDSLLRLPDELLDVPWLEKPVTQEDLLVAAASALKM